MSIEGRTRKDILDAALRAGRTGAHIAPSLSLVEIVLSVLGVFNDSEDTFVLSKGHGALGYYAAMHQMKRITDEQFKSFEKDGGDFPGQPSKSKDNCIEYSGGSLGMGIPYGAGRAWSNPRGKTYVVLGDGEVNEGVVWEAAALASSLKLSNLIAIVDQNGLQSDGKCNDIICMDLEKIWNAFGWNTKICDGHDINALNSALVGSQDEQRPTVILAQTIKGKGVSFMENDNIWHHKELLQSDYELALSEIGERYGFD